MGANKRKDVRWIRKGENERKKNENEGKQTRDNQKKPDRRERKEEEKEELFQRSNGRSSTVLVLKSIHASRATRGR